MFASLLHKFSIVNFKNARCKNGQSDDFMPRNKIPKVTIFMQCYSGYIM